MSDEPPVEDPSGLASSADGPRVLNVGWDGVVLVCRQCQKRGSGPPKLKAKQVAGALKTAAKRARLHPRIALTGCLGPCPKKAITVAAALPGGDAVRAWAVRSEDEAGRLAAQATTSASGA